jgi:hypothetical protein
MLTCLRASRTAVRAFVRAITVARRSMAASVPRAIARGLICTHSCPSTTSPRRT